MAVTLLDGARLAMQRSAMLAERALEVSRRRGRPPALLIVAFADEDGHVPHLERKVEACRAAGIDVTPLIIPDAVRTRDAVAGMRAALREGRYDGVFVQFPFPETMDGGAFAAAIPVALDVDIMTPVQIARFMNGIDRLPPLTVSAALMLLDEYGVSIANRRGIVIATESPFALLFRAALVLHGALMEPLVTPGSPDCGSKARAAELVVVAAASPGLVQVATLPPGAVAIDAGYFNPGGRGDIDLTGGFEHLAALSPVPGGIGPMTVSALIERVILFAELTSSAETATPDRGIL